MQGDMMLLFAQLLKSSQALSRLYVSGRRHNKDNEDRMRRLIDLMRILELLNKGNYAKLTRQI